MKRTLLKMSMIAVISIIAFSAKSYSLNNQVWNLGCQQISDLKQITFVDANNDGHYEAIVSVFCDMENGIDIVETNPIIYPIEATKGIPINDMPDPGNPLNPFKDLKYKGKKPPKPIKLSFFSDPNKTVLIYTLDWMLGNPGVIYTQYVPYAQTGVENPDMNNSITITPNPAQGDVNVLMNGNASSYKLFSQNGALMLSSNVEVSGTFNFSVNDLASGVYYLQIQSGSQTIVKPVYVVK